MKRFLKKASKILGYALVYVIITFGTAIGVIFLSQPSGNNNGNKNGLDDVFIAPQLSHIYDNLSTVKALKVNLDAEIETPTNNIMLELGAKLDIGESLTDIGAEGDIVVSVDEQIFDIDFKFIKGNLYIDVLGGKFLVETASIGDTLGSVLGLLNVEVPDLGLDLSSLNVDMILGMLSNLEEVQSENNITLNISVPVVGTIQLVCDLKYNVQSFSLPKTTISQGTTIAMGAKLDYPPSVSVNAPTTPYVNATHLLNVAEATLNYMKQDEIGFDLEVQFEDNTIKGNLSADLQDYSMKFTADLFGRAFNVVAIDNIFYLEYGNVNIKFALADSEMLTDFIYQQFGIKIPLNEIVNILVSIKEGTLLENLAKPESTESNRENTNKTDISNIDLSIIESFVKEGSLYTLTIRDLGKISVGVKEKNLESISFEGFGINAKLTTCKPLPIGLSNNCDDYADAAKLLPAVSSVFETLKRDNFVGNIKLTLNPELTLDLQFALTKKDGNLSATISTQYLGKNIVISYLDNKLYIQVDEIKLCAVYEDIEKLATLLKDAFGIVLPQTNFEFNNVIELLLEITDSTVNPLLIKSLVSTDNSVKIVLFNDMTLAATYENTLTSLNVTLDSIEFNLVLDATNNDIELPSLSETEKLQFVPVSSVIDKFYACYEYFKAQRIYIDFDINVDIETENNSQTYNVAGLLNFDENGLSLYAHTTYEGIDIELRLVNGVFYADVANVKAKFALDEINDLLEFVQNTLKLDLAPIFGKIEAQTGLDINALISDPMGELKHLTGSLDIKEAMNKVDIASVLENLSISLTDEQLSVTFGEYSANINFNENLISGANVNSPILNATINLYDKANDIAPQGDYVDIGVLLEKTTPIVSYIYAGSYYVDFDVTFDGFNVAGLINYDDNGYSIYAHTTYQTVPIEARIINGQIYVDIDTLKVMFNIEDLDKVISFVKDKFGYDLSSLLGQIEDKTGIDIVSLIVDPKTEINKLLKSDKLASTTDNIKKEDIIDIIKVLNLSFVDDVLTLSHPKISASVDFASNGLLGLQVNYDKINVLAHIYAEKNELSVSGEYFNITEAIPYVNMVIDYFSTKQYNLIADAKVYEKKDVIFETKDAQLQMDFASGLKFYGNVEVVGKTNHAMEASVYDGYLYVNYNGLLIKINLTDAKEILVIVMQMLGVDPSILPFLQDVANGIDISMDNMSNLASTLLPSLDLNNPLALVKFVDSISSTENSLKIVLNGSAISTNERAENMTIELISDGDKLSQIKLGNFYTGVSNEEHFDLDIKFAEFSGVTTPDTSKNYVDISGANELIKALINTSEMHDFNITANLNVKVKVGSLDMIEMEIPVNIQAKIVEGGKPEILATIGAIPVIDLWVYNLNNDTNFGATSTAKDRMAYIYYKDGYMYFYRHETSGNKSYEKKLKAPISTVASDILYYLQFVTGFNDDIINTIRKSLEIEHTIDLGKIINSFTVSEDKQSYTIKLDMYELTGDKNMGLMTLGIGLVDAGTESKKYIGKATFNLNLPFTSSLQMDLNSNDLTLTNINEALNGETLDFGEMYNYINSYTYDDNIEWEAYNGEWIKASEREFVVTFVTNSPHTLENIKGVQGTSFNLPYFEDYQISTSTEYDLYHFLGWYTRSDFAKGTEFTQGVIPGNNVTLYAKWESLESSRTVTYYNARGEIIETQYAKVGSALLNVADELIFEEVGNQLFTKKFVGWIDEDGYTRTRVPEDSMELYPKYETVNIKTQYTLSAETGIAPAFEPTLVYDSVETSSVLPAYTTDIVIGTTTYQFNGWYLDKEFTQSFDGVMPAHDLTVYAKWNEIEGSTLTIIDNGNEILRKSFAKGNAITLPSSIKVDENTQWFFDQEFTQPASLPDIMGEDDVTLYIRNKYTLTYTYYEEVNGVHTKKTESSSLYQGQTFNLPTLTNYELDYDLDRNGEKDTLIAYFFDGYNFNGQKVNGQITIANSDMNITANLSTQEEKWYKINLVYEWAVPSGTIGSSWIEKTPITYDRNTFFVLGNASITGVTLTYKDSLLDTSEKQLDFNASCKYSYKVFGISTSHNYNAINYNMSGCYNHGASNGKASTNTITGDTTLYVEWDD